MYRIEIDCRVSKEGSSGAGGTLAYLETEDYAKVRAYQDAMAEAVGAVLRKFGDLHAEQHKHK